MTYLECKVEGEIRRVVLGHKPVTIGRLDSCDFPFPHDREVSRTHAQFERRNGVWFVVDHGSTNGTMVNGQRVTVPHPIREGDTIQVGEQRVVVKTWLDYIVTSKRTVPFSGYPHFYIVLRVPFDATQDEIDEAHDNLSRIYDPELHPGSELVHQLRNELEEAYATIGISENRRVYDESLGADPTFPMITRRESLEPVPVKEVLENKEPTSIFID